jgi:endonuclease/exonuclease/phosphatase family metal-dependent hydrolase
MKILQLNIWGGRLGTQISELIRAEEPDVVCLQEVIDLEGKGGLFFTGLDKIKTDAGFEHSDFSPSFGFSVMKRRAQFGIATLSVLPFIKTVHIPTGLAYVDNFDVLDMDYNIRTLQHTEYEYCGQPLHILNHHGHHIPAHKDGNAETLRQCKLVLDYINGLTGQIVLCGDFNLQVDSASLQQLNTQLTNHVKEKAIVTTRTNLTPKTEACDYIFTNAQINVKEFRVLEKVASDHKALVIEF